MLQRPQPEVGFRDARNRHRRHHPHLSVRPAFKRAAQHQAVDDGTQHPDVVGFGTFDAPVLGVFAAQDIPAPDHHPDRKAQLEQRYNLTDQMFQLLLIEPETVFPGERAADEFEHHPVVFHTSLHKKGR